MRFLKTEALKTCLFALVKTVAANALLQHTAKTLQHLPYFIHALTLYAKGELLIEILFVLPY